MSDFPEKIRDIFKAFVLGTVMLYYLDQLKIIDVVVSGEANIFSCLHRNPKNTIKKIKLHDRVDVYCNNTLPSYQIGFFLLL